jgi:hypothetical protein
VKRAWILVFAAACVPATDEREPRGAAGFLTDPSPASRQEPFTTSDGWTVRIETLAMNATVYAYAQSAGGGYSGGGGEGYLFDGAAATQIFVPALPVGRYNVNAQFSYGYVYDGRVSQRYENFGVDEDVERRMTTRADVPPDAYNSDYAPSIVIIASAERLGRVVRLDAGLATSTFYSSGSGIGTGPSVEVRANTVALLRLGVHAEALFDREGALVFDDIAAADRNGDGRVTEAELAATPAECPRCSSGGVRATLYEAIRLRSQSVLRAR